MHLVTISDIKMNDSFVFFFVSKWNLNNVCVYFDNYHYCLLMLAQRQRGIKKKEIIMYTLLCDDEMDFDVDNCE